MEKKQYHKYEAQINIPFVFVPDFDSVAVTERINSETGETFNSYSWGGTVGGEDYIVYVNKELKDKADMLATKRGVPYVLCKKQAGKGTAWEISPQNAPVSTPAPQEVSTPQPAAQNPTQPQNLPQEQRIKETMIVYQALWKATSPEKNYDERVKEVVLAEKMFRQIANKIAYNQGEPTTDEVQKEKAIAEKHIANALAASEIPF